MYLWNIDRLVTKLKNNTLPKWQTNTFYIISPLLSICNALFFSTMLLSHHFVSNFFAHFLQGQHEQMDFYNRIALVTGTLTMMITFLGIYLCYRTNQKGDGKRFSERMASLSFPINFHLTVYVFALLSIVTIAGYLIIHGKVVLFKSQIMSLSKSDSTIGQAVKEALKDSSLKAVIPHVKKSTSFLGTIFKAPVTILRLPTIPGQINSFLRSLRATILIAYPIVSLFPPALSLCHYLVIRRMLKRISQ
jgi:hypothetical protein